MIAVPGAVQVASNSAATATSVIESPGITPRLVVASSDSTGCTYQAGLNTPRGQLARIISANSATNSSVAATCMRCWRHPSQARKNSGADTSDGSAPLHGSSALHRPPSTNRQTTP